MNISMNSCFTSVGAVGLEPTTYHLADDRSIQLSYAPIFTLIHALVGVEPTGLEPATSRWAIRHSAKLSYGPTPTIISESQVNVKIYQILI